MSNEVNRLSTTKAMIQMTVTTIIVQINIEYKLYQYNEHKPEYDTL